MDIREVIKIHKERTDKILNKYCKGEKINHRVINKMTVKEIEELELTLKELNEERKEIKERAKEMGVFNVAFMEFMDYPLLIADLRTTLAKRKREIKR